nr:MAG TPA: hypothetical protein [Caudoviricetes sp.]
MKYDITRLPVIKSKHFNDEAVAAANAGMTDEQYTTAQGQKVLWYMYVLDKLNRGDSISVAELRKAANKKVELKDYMFGFDKRALDYTSPKASDDIFFHPMHLKQIVPNNIHLYDTDNLYRLKRKNAEIYRKFVKRLEESVDMMLDDISAQNKEILRDMKYEPTIK